jgi:hypothetical protein
MAPDSLPLPLRDGFNWQEGMPVQWDLPVAQALPQSFASDWNMQLGGAVLTLGDRLNQLRMDGLTVAAQALAPGQAVPALTLDASLALRVRKRQLSPWSVSLALDAGADAERLDLQLRLQDIAQSLRLELEGVVDPATGGGQFHLHFQSLDLPYASTWLVPLLRDFKLLEQDLVLERGEFALTTELDIAGAELEQLDQRSGLEISGLAGTYGEYLFEGVGFSAAWTGIEQWRTTAPATLSVQRLFIGFDLLDTRLVASLPQPTPFTSPALRLEQFSTTMFGGQLFLPAPRPWDFGAASNSLVLRAENWLLADMVALQQNQDILARGVLEGELPVTLSDGRLTIDKGYLRARAPGGAIRYLADESAQALAGSSSELGLALELLKDFQYQTLDSEVALDQSGNLLLGLSLSGRNPAQFDGRQIKFNINLEQNIDPLLQSLRLSDNLVEKLEKGLR